MPIAEPAANALAPARFQKHLSFVLPDQQASPEQIAALKRMTPDQRWRAAYRLYWTARRHKAAFIHSQHPDWPDTRIQEEVRRIFSNART